MRKRTALRINARRGVSMMYLLTVMTLVGLVGASILLTTQERYGRGIRLRQTMALEQMAAGGVERARAELARSTGYAGDERLPLGLGEVRIAIERGAGVPAAIHVTAAVPTLENPRRTIERRALLPGAAAEANR